jgi:5-formyltetrahydrofolate cyclo-ligase
VEGAFLYSSRLEFFVAASASALDVKTELRRRLREQRCALTPDARRLAAEQLAANLVNTRAFRAGRRVACYLPNDGEIDTGRVIEHIRRLHKHCYLPVLSRLSHDRLWFAPANFGAELVVNRHGILEPVAPTRALVRAQDLDLVLLPLVGFDETGHRLGMGGGYYDRSLTFLHHRRYWRKPHVIGLAYDFQKVTALPRDAWDVPLDTIVTDRAVYLVQEVDGTAK